jgi:UPF0271 protein
MRVDLNADLGEGFGPWPMGADDALLQLVTSANIACGFHAGDPLIMTKTVRRASELGVDIGAHVGFPDLQGFGRRPMQIPVEELAAMVVYQLGALDGIARSVGARVKHMSFHGALGNMAAADAELAGPLIEAVASFDPTLIVVSSTSAAIEGAAARCGLKVATTFLADRAYGDDGLLVPRGRPGAVIHDRATVLERVRLLLREGRVITAGGASLAMPAHSILLHGDNAEAVDFARTVRGAIQEAGGAVVPVSGILAGAGAGQT